MVLRRNGTLAAWGSGNATNIPPGLTDVVGVKAGGLSSLALLADGNAICWGDFGQTNVPADLTNIIEIADGMKYAVALRDDGSPTAWGDDTYGQTQVPPFSNVVAIATGGYHGLALLGRGPPQLKAAILDPGKGPTGFTLSIPTQFGKVYSLEYKSSLADNLWRALPLVAGDSSVKMLTDTTAAGAQRFYRVRQW